ncbi:LEA type 2 family protein [Chitinilyticum piscinae]|uniref:LEA type 2 family protein n=1 Tax=Chitinilyticum piscinae TaxID=2866724 RepID=A0A8J7FTS7_9NEIS|nr:LEA type 2 family protein [Chitinilyticum piscinae]MBE9610431.1 LEA type 2 family protein [Chitinilyticum piscinae]
MKKLLQPLILLVALVLAGCAANTGLFQRPQVNISGIRIEELGLLEQRFELQLRVSNPNGFAIPLDGLKASLEVNGKPFAEGLSNQKISLAALSDTTVKIKVTSNLASALKTLNRLMAADQPLNYRATGTLYLPMVPGGVDFDRSGEVPILDKLK